MKPEKWDKIIFWAVVIGAIFYFKSPNETSAPPAPTQQTGSPSEATTLSQPPVPSIIGQRIYVKDVFDARLGCPNASDLISFYGSEKNHASSKNSNGDWLDAMADAFREDCINFNPGDTGLVIEQFPLAMPQNGNPVLVNVDLVRMDGTNSNLFMLDYFVAPIKP